MERILKEKVNSKNVSDLINLDLSNSDLCSLDNAVLEKCVNLESLNLSKNRLKDLSRLVCPKLKSLNCEDNCISNLKFLSRLPSLETLYIDGNPINVADRYIAVDQLPYLHTLDGKSCSDIQTLIKEFREKLNSQGHILYERKYENMVKNCISTEDITRYQKLFFRELFDKVSPGNKMPSAFIRYKVQNFAENLFSSCVISSKLDSTPQSVNISPIKNLLKSCNISKTPKKTKPDNSSTFGSPSKRLRSKYDDQYIDYEPQLILRIHSSNPQDKDTPVWCAAFEPDIEDETKTTELLATGGGNTVCFLNCKIGYVLMKYKGENAENFYALDWTILPFGDKGKITVLAAGGNNKMIYLIAPIWQVCYLSFKAHTQAIDTIHFHPSNKTWLFTGGKEKNIHLWDIGVPQISDLEKTRHKKLMTFKVGFEILRILFSSHFNTLFAATNHGLQLWNLSSDVLSWTSVTPANVIIPNNCKSNVSEIIDGMAFVNENILAIKVSKSGKIFLWDFSATLSERKLKRQKTINISPSVILVWDDCMTDYIYIDSCKETGLLACGDNTGRLWLYNLKRYTNKSFTTPLEAIEELPNAIFPWPKLTFDEETLATREEVIINSVKFNWNGEYLIMCTDSNLLCIWRKTV